MPIPIFSTPLVKNTDWIQFAYSCKLALTNTDSDEVSISNFTRTTHWKDNKPAATGYALNVLMSNVDKSIWNYLAKRQTTLKNATLIWDYLKTKYGTVYYADAGSIIDSCFTFKYESNLVSSFEIGRE